jgi:hypothetical protein
MGRSGSERYAPCEHMERGRRSSLSLRKQGTLVSLDAHDAIGTASAERIKLEIDAKGDPNVEVVILVAKTRQTLDRTHSRYFRSPSELLADLAAAVKAEAALIRR